MVTANLVMRPVAQKDARGNDAYQVREHLTEAEMDKLLGSTCCGIRPDTHWRPGNFKDIWR